MDKARETWRQFFHLPMDVKQQYANSPKTYEGYGSRLGVEKGAILDWSDYYYLHYLPLSGCPSRTITNGLPCLPHAGKSLRSTGELVKLCGRLLRLFSINLGLDEKSVENGFGGEDIGACLRVNFDPSCPRPDLTLGLSSHSDPGGMTMLLPDDQVPGLQVRKCHDWITVKPQRHAFIVNIGDQIQVSSLPVIPIPEFSFFGLSQPENFRSRD
uniref:Leucoanthocyanidin dioxygenase n=1 Tax=Cajanus cajan TaxID=3821 RepID=A0A151S6W7_CAJCA|nr:Leucoanthocyanidin dioxygenase [Cajanus cajan]